MRLQQRGHARLGVGAEHGRAVGLDETVTDNWPDHAARLDHVQVRAQEQRRSFNRGAWPARDQVADFWTGVIVVHRPAQRLEFRANGRGQCALVERRRIDGHQDVRTCPAGARSWRSWSRNDR